MIHEITLIRQLIDSQNYPCKYSDGEAGRNFENERKVTQRVRLGVVSPWVDIPHPQSVRPNPLANMQLESIIMQAGPLLKKEESNLLLYPVTTMLALLMLYSLAACLPADLVAQTVDEECPPMGRQLPT